MFILPWLLGLLAFFLQPLFRTLQYSLTNFVIGKEGGYELQPLARGLLSNYLDAFVKDADFLRLFSESVQRMLYQVPVIVLFSLFIALVLAQKFRGRILMRGIFFLPVIITTGLIVSIIRTSLFEVARGGSSSTGNIYSSAMLATLLYQSGLPQQLITILTTIINNIVDLVWQSGIQVLIFLAGVLSIPRSYYECASIEGATGWEAFWKVTLPIVSPHILVNLIYTTIDSFTNYNNSVMQYVLRVVYRQIRFSYGSALYWLYFLAIVIFVLVMYWIANRRVHYDVS